MGSSSSVSRPGNSGRASCLSTADREGKSLGRGSVESLLKRSQGTREALMR